MSKRMTELAVILGVITGTAILSVVFKVPMVEMVQYSMLGLIVKIAVNQQN